jgi:cyclase
MLGSASVGDWFRVIQGASVSASAEDPGGSGPPRVEQVSDGIWAYVQPDGSWWINNTGFLVGRKGVVSIDSCSTERRTRAYLARIASVTELPVRTLINTHHHGDHTHGNYLFGAATIIGHEGVREEMQRYAVPRSNPVWTEVDWGAIELEPPFVTYREGVTLWVDDLRCEVRHVATPAHTTNDSIVWIPERSVLFAGDLVFNGGTPFLLMGSIAGAVRAIEALKLLEVRTVIPGHGDVCGPEIFDRVLGYLAFIGRLAQDGHAAGVSPLDAARGADLGPYAGWLDAERIVGNLHRAYSELDGAALGSPIDVVAALADMVAYNGGKPLSCHA